MYVLFINDWSEKMLDTFTLCGRTFTTYSNY